MTAIYNITHFHNLPNILNENGLWCDSESVRRNLQPVEIVYTEIMERRTRIEQFLREIGLNPASPPAAIRSNSRLS